MFIRRKREDIRTRSFTQLYERYYERLFLFAFSILRNRQDCEDVIADTFITIWDHWVTFENVSDPLAYLYIAVKNNCLKLKRKYSSLEELLTETPIEILIDRNSPETLLISEEGMEKLNRTIRKLPERCKLIFLMAKEQNLSYKEIASILEISPKTVHAQIHIALSHIRQSIEKIKKS